MSPEGAGEWTGLGVGVGFSIHLKGGSAAIHWVRSSQPCGLSCQRGATGSLLAVCGVGVVDGAGSTSSAEIEAIWPVWRIGLDAVVGCGWVEDALTAITRPRESRTMNETRGRFIWSPDIFRHLGYSGSRIEVVDRGLASAGGLKKGTILEVNQMSRTSRCKSHNRRE